MQMVSTKYKYTAGINWATSFFVYTAGQIAYRT